MGSKRMRGRVLRVGSYVVLTCLLWLLVPVAEANAWPAGVDHSIFYLDSDADSLQTNPGLPADMEEEAPEESGKRNAKKIMGASLFGSGIFLCSWGIASWQTDDTQCCPTNNTQNVIKIVIGVLLLNAGLIYLLEVQ